MKHKSHHRVTCCILALAAIAPEETRASSIGLDTGAPLITVTAESRGALARLAIAESQLVRVGDGWRFMLSAPTPILSDSGAEIASLQRLHLLVLPGPRVSLNFLVIAGGSPTAFSLASALVSFPTIHNTIGRASAGITITDLDGDGASLSGGFHDSLLNYRAYAQGPSGDTVFATLVSDVSIGSGGSVTSHQQFPLPTGSFSAQTQDSANLGTTEAMRSAFEFTLSANDAAGGTSVFELDVPEPTTSMLLFSLAMMTARCRRFRRHRRSSST